jgi:hypothetical protein
MRETGCTYVGGPNECEFVAMGLNHQHKVCLYCGQSEAESFAKNPRNPVMIYCTQEEFEALRKLMPTLFRNP